MTTLGIIDTMTMEQAKTIAKVIHSVKMNDMESAKGVMDNMSVEELDLLIAYIEAVQAEKEEAIT